MKNRILDRNITFRELVCCYVALENRIWNKIMTQSHLHEGHIFFHKMKEYAASYEPAITPMRM